MPKSKPGPAQGHSRATAANVLRAAAGDWASGEAAAMRRAGLAAWSGKGDDCFARWQIPLQAVHDDTEAYLTICTTDWDGTRFTPWRLVWQLTALRRDQRQERVCQADVVQLDGAVTTEDLEDARAALLSIDPDAVLEWVTAQLAKLALGHLMHA